MNSKSITTRRSFFRNGGAALGAGIAGASGATAAPTDVAASDPAELASLRSKLTAVAERRAIEQLQAQFLQLMNTGAYAAAATLFADDAKVDMSGEAANGAEAIQRLLVTRYGQQLATNIHRSYRRSTAQGDDVYQLNADQRTASAQVYAEVELCCPLTGNSTPEQMARLQGQVAQSRWEQGVLAMSYTKHNNQWLIASLRYQIS
jgi:SnoaL-like domain